jgi:hypothetical protein
MLLEDRGGATVHRVVVILRDRAGAGELDACDAGISGGALRHPLGYG